MHNFVFIFYDQYIGRYEEALVYYQEALDVRRLILGNTHPSTLISISKMGSVLQAQGDVNNTNMLCPILLISHLHIFTCMC